MAKQPNFYSVEGAAKALGIPLRECRRLIENGRLRAEVITGVQIIRRSNLNNLKERLNKPAAKRATAVKPKLPVNPSGR